MTRIFKKNDIVNLLVLLPYTIALRFHSFLYPVAYEVHEHDGVINTIFFESILPDPLMQAILATLLIYIHAVFINNLANRNRIFGSQCGYAGMLYVLLSSLIPSLLRLTPILIGMTFFLVGVYYAFRVYKRNNASKEIFNSAIVVAISSVFYPPFLIISLAIFIEFFVLRSFSFKEQLQFFVGIISMLWILGSFLYFTDFISFDLFKQFGIGVSYSFMIPNTTADIIAYAFLVLIFLISLMSYYAYHKKKNVESRKKIDFFYIIFSLLIFSIFLFRELEPSHLLILVFPFSVLIAMNFYSLKNWARAELFHLVLVLVVFYVQYGEGLQLDHWR